MTVPKEKATATSHDGIVVTPRPTGEGAPFVLRTPEWEAQSFAPKKLMVGVGVTNEMFREGGSFLVDYVTRMAAVDFSNQLEWNVLNGTGVGGQVPKGLLNYDNLTTSTGLIPAIGGGRPLAFVDLIGMDQSIINANRATPGASLGYYMASQLLMGLRTQYAKTAEDSTVLNSLPITPLQFMSVEQVEKYIGHKLGYSTLMPTGKIVYGDWKQFWIGTWGPMEMLMSNVASVGQTNAFAQDMTFVRFVQMYDSAVMMENAFTKLEGFTAAAA
jgi:HK97 family phage major capsid protein